MERDQLALARELLGVGRLGISRTWNRESGDMMMVVVMGMVMGMVVVMIEVELIEKTNQ